MALYLDFQILLNLQPYGSGIPKRLPHPSKHLPFQSHWQKQWKNLRNIFTVNSKDIKTKSMTPLLLTLNILDTFFYFCCWLWTGKCLFRYFTKYPIYQLFNFLKLKTKLKKFFWKTCLPMFWGYALTLAKIHYFSYTLNTEIRKFQRHWALPQTFFQST